MKYYLVIERNEVLTCVSTGMSLGDIFLNERSQSQKTTYLRFPLYEMMRLGKSIETERRLVVA